MADHPRRQRGRPLAARVLNLLPPPRDAAAASLARSVVALVRGTPLRTPAAPKGGPADRDRRYREALVAEEAGETEGALEVVDALLAESSDDLAALRLRRRLLVAGGPTPRLLRAVRAERDLRDRPELASLERWVEGCLAIADSRWEPLLERARATSETPGPPDGVLHLLSTDPASVADPAYPLRERILADLEAGRRPAVLVVPRKGTGAGPRVTTLLEGIAPTAVTPPLDAFDGPDLAVADVMWRAERLVGDTPTGQIHVLLSPSIVELGVAALGLHRRCGARVLVDVVDDRITTLSGPGDGAADGGEDAPPTAGPSEIDIAARANGWRDALMADVLHGIEASRGPSSDGAQPG